MLKYSQPSPITSVHHICKTIEVLAFVSCTFYIIPVLHFINLENFICLSKLSTTMTIITEPAPTWFLRRATQHLRRSWPVSAMPLSMQVVCLRQRSTLWSLLDWRNRHYTQPISILTVRSRNSLKRRSWFSGQLIVALFITVMSTNCCLPGSRPTVVIIWPELRSSSSTLSSRRVLWTWARPLTRLTMAACCLSSETASLLTVARRPAFAVTFRTERRLLCPETIAVVHSLSCVAYRRALFFGRSSSLPT